MEVSLMVGKELRLSRILDPEDGRAVVVAADHGFMLGPIPGADRLADTLRRVIAGKPDAVLLSPGQAINMHDLFLGRDKPAILIRVDWTSAFRDRTYPLPARTVAFSLSCTPRKAVKLGAQGIVSYFFVGYEDEEFEAMQYEMLARLSRECDEIGLPFVVEPVPMGPRVTKANRTDLIVMSVRMATEIGADMLKVPYTGDPESFKRVVDTAYGTPVLILGGYRALTMKDMLEVIEEALEVGARGVVFGRNVIQSPDPARTLEAIRAIVHEGKSVRDVVLGEIKGRMRLVVDNSKCTGCGICEMICSFMHEGFVDAGLARLRVEGSWPGPFSIKVCIQCTKCVSVCPTGALERDEKLGYIKVDPSKCTLCGECVEVCPNQVIILNKAKPHVLICDLCGGLPECVYWCPRDAIRVMEVRAG